MRIVNGTLHAYVRSNPFILFDATAIFLLILRAIHTFSLDNVNVSGETISTRAPSPTSSASAESGLSSEEQNGEPLPEYGCSPEPESPSVVPLRVGLLGGSDEGLISTKGEGASDEEWIPVSPPGLDHAQGPFWTVAG